MQINNSSVNPLLTSPQVKKTQQADNKTLINNQGEQARAKEDNSQQQNQSTRFDADQQALTRVELYNAERSTDKVSTSSPLRGEYDQPTQQNQFAVNSYQKIENIAQRESIKQAFGVDLYA